MPQPDNQSAPDSNLPPLPPGYTLDGSPGASSSFSTGVSSQLTTTDVPAVPPLPAGYKLDEQPSALSRFAGAATESSSGLPADIKKWPEALRSMGSDSFTGKPGPHGPSIFNAPANIVKGIATGSASASQRGLDQFSQPGAINKTVGGLKYIIGGLPIIGPNIVKSMEAAENGDYAGMFGTLSGMGLQAAMANPEATATRIDAAGKYLFSKPRVQETILAGEAKEMLTAAEAAAREKGHAKFPSSTATIPGADVSNVASKAISDHIQGSPDTPGPLKSMMADDSFKRVGAIERVGGGLQDIFARMASEDPVTMRDAHGYYTELGRYAERDLPGDVYAAVKQTRDDLGKLIGDQYDAEGKLGQWQDAKSYWSDLHKHWWDTDSPLYKAMNSQDPHETLQSLLGPSGDTADRTAAYLRNYTNEGADPKIVKAASTLFKGMDQMRIRGLYQASGGLLLAMMLREFGVPTAANAATVGTLLGSRLARGYFNTRPSLTSLLSDEIKPSTWKSYPLKDDIKSNPSPFSGSGGMGGPSAQPPPPAPVTPVAPVPAAIPTVDHSASTITPTESSFLSAIKDHPSIHPDLKADIEAATSPQSNVKVSNIISRMIDIDKQRLPMFEEHGITSTSDPSTPQELHDLTEEQYMLRKTLKDEHGLSSNDISKLYTNHPKYGELTKTIQDLTSFVRSRTTGEVGKELDKVTNAPDLSTISVDRLKGIMDIMKYQKMGYNEATKIYNQINGGKGL